MRTTTAPGALVSLIALAVGGCAFPQQVERFGVEYNTALATMSNEQTLLNILRAKEGLPAHFTSVNRFNGTLGMKAAGSLNSVLRGDGLTSTVNSGQTLSTTTAQPSVTTVVNAMGTATTTATPGISSVAGTTGGLSDVIAEGVDQYTPQVSGEFNSGTAFEVAVFDSQKFYNGYLAAVPFTVVENYISQGFDPKLIFMLFVSRIDFKYDQDMPEAGVKKGNLAFSIENTPENFSAVRPFADCFRLTGEDFTPAPTRIAAMSRFTGGQQKKPVKLDLEKFAMIDGEKFALSSKDGLAAAASGDSTVFLTNVAKKTRIARLISTCPENPVFTSTGEVFDKDNPPKDNVFQLTSPRESPKTDQLSLVFSAQVPVPKRQSDGSTRFHLVKADLALQTSFRSPEGLLRYLGAYLRKNDKAPIQALDGKPVFSLTSGRAKGALVATRFNGQAYSLVNPPGSVRYSEVLNIVQQVVNLQKESTERPITIPVRTIPQ